MKPTDAKHTPGPWYYDDGQVYTRYCDRPESGICDLRGSDNTQADGELIASAPDLLAERDALRAEVAKLRAALTELRSYADLKLQGHRQDYDEDHCMVQTALRMIALADDALK